MATTDDQVGVLLELAGLTPNPAELEKLVDQFPAMRAGIERLWALDLGDAQPSLVFRAAEAVGASTVDLEG